MNKYVERLYNGVIKENPTFVLMLGMCPTLAVTTSAINGVGMGLSTTVVLVLSNMLISMLRKIIPDSVRMPAFIVVVASFVTIVQFLLEGFVPSLYDALGLYIPLIVVNCIILGRAESPGGEQADLGGQPEQHHQHHGGQAVSAERDRDFRQRQLFQERRRHAVRLLQGG